MQGGQMAKENTWTAYGHRARSVGAGRAKEKTRVWEYVVLCVCIGFYLLFPLLDGPVHCVDSDGYISMHITREPLYPLFLALCRGIARLLRADALMTAAVLQSVLAGIATWLAGYVVMRVKDGSRILQAAAVFFQFAVTLLCRFAANRGSAYTDSILTEGLGLSLFVLYILCLFLYVQTARGRYLWLTLALSFLLVSLRKQMLITLLIMGIVFFRYVLLRDRNVRRFLALMAAVTAVFLAAKLFDRTYQYMVRGVWMEHSGNSMGLLCTLLYTSDAARDRGLFADEETAELYERIMEQAKERQLLYPYAGKGWLAVSSHYADSYDAIGYGIINPVVEGYLAERFVYSETERAVQYDAVCGEMSRTLLRQGWMPLFRVYVYNTWKGLVNSVAQANRLLSLYAAAAYAAVGIGAWYLAAWKRKTGRMERQIGSSLCFVFIVLTGIAVNACTVGLMIFAQPRYMIYGMGLFYTAGSMVLSDCLLALGKNI